MHKEAKEEEAKVTSGDDTRILILAGGKAGQDHKSWQDKRERFLLPIAGEPLLLRTTRLCRQLGYLPTIVTSIPAVQVAVGRYFNPGPNKYVWDTIRGTRELWRKRTVFLVGDVLFFTDTLERILTSRETCSWEGTWGGDTFGVIAVVFNDEKWETVSGWCELAWQEAERRGNSVLQILKQLKLIENVIYDDARDDVYDFDLVRYWEECVTRFPWILGNEPQD